MSSQRREEFEKRAAEVFGALDSHKPRHTSTLTHARGSRDTKDQSHDPEPSKKRRRPAEEAERTSEESPPWKVRVQEAGQSGDIKQASSRWHQRRHRSSHHVSETDPRARESHSSSQSSRGLKPRRPTRVPEYLTRPERWTRYTLREDGTRPDIQGLNEDQINRHAALQFLDELKRRKTSESVGGNSAMDTDSKGESGAIPSIQFRKPKSAVRLRDTKQRGFAARTIEPLSPPRTLQEDFTSPHHGNGSHGNSAAGGHSAFRMPEYVVGANKSGKSRERKRPKLQVANEEEAEVERGEDKEGGGGVRGVTARTVISLSHLAEDELED